MTHTRTPRTDARIFHRLAAHLTRRYRVNAWRLKARDFIALHLFDVGYEKRRRFLDERWK